jgi:peroxiredoxin
VAAEYTITTPLVSDEGGHVAQAYGVLRWAVPSGEPGHTFVLVDGDGDVAWIQDYGAPENRGVMYVAPEEITQEVMRALAAE